MARTSCLPNPWTRSTSSPLTSGLSTVERTTGWIPPYRIGATTRSSGRSSHPHPESAARAHPPESWTTTAQRATFPLFRQEKAGASRVPPPPHQGTRRIPPTLSHPLQGIRTRAGPPRTEAYSTPQPAQHCRRSQPGRRGSTLRRFQGVPDRSGPHRASGPPSRERQRAAPPPLGSAAGPEHNSRGQHSCRWDRSMSHPRRSPRSPP